MLRKASKRLLKRTLRVTKAKLLYTRITLTRFTTLYFFFALFSCVILVILQGVTYADNSVAVQVLDSVLVSSNVTRDLAIFSKGELKVCSHLPEHSEMDCVVIASSNLLPKKDSANQLSAPHPTAVSAALLSRPHHLRRDDSEQDPTSSHKQDKYSTHDNDDEEDEGRKASKKGDERANMNDNSVAESSNIETVLSKNCVLSLSWLEDALHDAKREDVVTLTFHFWLFSLSVVTILNESLPHLGAALLAHILAAGWASFRVESSEKLANVYRRIIVPGPCNGVDHLQNWWETRRLHAISILAMNVVTLLGIAFVSFKLFKVYATQTFSRVGASPEIHGVYKLVLFFSVGLQLSAFFTLASTSVWIDKICHGVIKSFADHRTLYLAAFIVILVLQIPWLIMGWVCVRRECSIRFFVFCAISLFILTISTLLFFSPLYRFIFGSWSFFATLTVTSYVLLVLTSVLGILCRINFGRGLAHYLRVSDVLDGVDFTPVYFSKGGQEADLEKLPRGFETKTVVIADLPSAYRPARKGRGSSIYSEVNGVPLHLSSTPPLLSELTPKSRRTSLTSVWTSRSRRVSNHTRLSGKGVREYENQANDSSQADYPSTVMRTVPQGLPADPRPSRLNETATAGGKI